MTAMPPEDPRKRWGDNYSFEPSATPSALPAPSPVIVHPFYGSKVVEVKSPKLGQVALILAGLLFLAVMIPSISIGTTIIDAPSVEENLTAGKYDIFFLLFLLVGVPWGIGCLVVSILAIVQHRGRRQAILALIVTALTPILSFVSIFGVLVVVMSG